MSCVCLHWRRQDAASSRRRRPSPTPEAQSERGDIAVVESSGTGTIIVTSDADGQRSDNYSPAWSPSRQRIAFFTNRDGNAEIYVAVADGSDFLRVTNTLHEETQVSWAADGNRLAYTTVSFDGESSVHWVSLSDLQPHRLLAGSFGETDPTWSPTGPWIAFTRLNEEGESIGLFLRDPSTVNNIPLTTAVDHGPVWSPDGTKIAYISTVDGNEEDPRSQDSQRWQPRAIDAYHGFARQRLRSRLVA